MSFWANGSYGSWKILNGSWFGLTITSVVIGVGGAVAEALDLGLDDNLTLPILSGALMWTWLSITNVLLR
jgi:diacylglycerol kinase (CTP)